MRFDFHVFSRKRLLGQTACGQNGQRPIPRVLPPTPFKLADTWNSRQQDSARLEGAIERPHSGFHVIDQMERLRQNDAVKDIGRDVFRRTQIAYECRLRVSFLHVQDVAARDAVTAEPLGVAVVADLQDPAADIGFAAREEPLNIKTVYRCPAIKAEFAAKGRQAAEIPKPRRPSGKQATTKESRRQQARQRVYVSGSQYLDRYPVSRSNRHNPANTSFLRPIRQSSLTRSSIKLP